jgi:trk system potassium uptake protein TrkH
VRTAARPAQLIAGAFGTAIAVGTALLSLSAATQSGERAPLVDALFTSTSAVCVTGLVTVDTETYWSTFGKAVILGLIQVGGLGIMTVATLVAVVLFRRTSLATRMALQAETKAVSAEDLRRIVRRIVVFSLVSEAVLAAILTVRFLTRYDQSAGEAVWSGVFHAVSAFNNAGFSLYSNNLMDFLTDAWVLLPISAAVIVGGLGFPVVFELLRSWRQVDRWSALTRVTVAMTATLLALGTVAMLVAEADNPETWGDLPPGQQLVASFFSATMPRTAGFNAVDIADMRPETLVLTDFLMFIGGGSAGTAGGIKVTTVGLLLFAVVAELRGRTDVEIGRRRISSQSQRQALAVAVISAGTVAASILLLMALTPFRFEEVAFEVVSAFGTVGLSTGITYEMPTSGKILLTLLMFAGRIGPLTFALALAARYRSSLHRRPEEKMSIG